MYTFLAMIFYKMLVLSETSMKKKKIVFVIADPFLVKKNVFWRKISFSAFLASLKHGIVFLCDDSSGERQKK